MRNPGWNHEQVWSASCDVKFNGADFGPNLQYGKLKFLPAKTRKQRLTIAGLPGVYDYSDSPGGYPVPDNLQGTLELFVLDPLAWQTPVYDADVGTMISPEGRFLGMIAAGKVRLDFINSNRMYLMADLEVSKYDRFELGFNITLKVDAEPYWWESDPQTLEWYFQAPSVNYFDPNDITITPYLPSATCTYEAAQGDPDRKFFLLHAPPGGYADVTIPDLNPAKTYSFSCRNIFNKGSWQLYDEGGHQIYKITGVETLTLRLISNSAAVLAVGFADVVIYEVTGAGVMSSEIRTLDAPLQTLRCTSTQSCRLTIGETVFPIQAGSDLTIYGLNIPPRTTVPVMVTGDSGCRGYIAYRRGAMSCTY